MSQWSLYLVRCRKGTLYAGIAIDPKRRLAEHESGRGAKYLRGRGPLELVFEQTIGNRSQALQAERRLKKMGRAQKEALIESFASGGAREWI